jgi:alkylated DNA repair dioxygenase AlkB
MAADTPSDTANDLFGDAAPPGIDGLRYEPDFLTRAEESELIAIIGGLALQPALYKGYVARRKVKSFGGSFDYDDNVLRPATPLDAALHPLRRKVAQWLQLDESALVHALVAEYAPGTPLGWHRDVPDFEWIAGVSLGSAAELRFRPYPPTPQGNRRALRLEAAPRSVYLLAGAARWAWQHCVPAVPALRWSITFRTGRVGVQSMVATQAHVSSRDRTF